ncbi:MAG: AAA family ATPase [Nannocystis sp.]|nr:AAA family ATPase [Nannocystis sp.]
MLTRIELSNLGPIAALDWQLGPGINVIIGENDTGKTLLLKMLYACVRSAEAYRRGDDARTVRQILDDKLTWTFQLPTLGDLVSKAQDDPLNVRLRGRVEASDLEMDFQFTRKAKKGVGELTTNVPPIKSTSLFIPAKEVLSLIAAIKESRQAQKFGFDDPTYDLVLALERAPSRGTPPFGDARGKIEELISGRVIEKEGVWTFQRGNHHYPVAITAEGVKKIAIIDRLIVNRSLTGSSVLFVDEPESFLHPSALVRFLDILHALSKSGLQVVLATHSLTAMRKIVALSRGSDTPVPLLSLQRDQAPECFDLVQGMPPNALSRASVALYEEELGISPSSDIAIGD